jgi:hypothetical protein
MAPAGGVTAAPKRPLCFHVPPVVLALVSPYGGAKNMKDNQQTHLKGTLQSLHYTTQRTHARLFLERGAAFLPSFPQPSGEY